MIVGLFYGIIQLISLFKTSEYQILATGEHHVIRFSNSFYTNLDKYMMIIDFDSLDTRIKGGNSIDRSKTISSLREYFKSYFPFDLQEQVRNLKSQWSFSITNTGSKEIKNLNLELPFDGTYLLLSNGEESESGRFNKVIDIASLRPKNEIDVIVWTNDWWESSNESKTRITFAEGYFEIGYSIPVSGFLAWIHQIGIFMFILIIFWIIFVVLFVISLFYNARSKNPKNKIENSKDDEPKQETNQVST